MWIDNYDSPEELTLEDALELLRQNGYKDITEEYNAYYAKQQANATNPLIPPQFRVYEDPSGEGVHCCEFDYDAIELAMDLEWQAEGQRSR